MWDNRVRFLRLKSFRGNQMAQRGGARPGAGRPKGRRDKATPDQIATLEELAREHTRTALDALVAIATASDSDAARVSAANALLDRAYGRPKQAVQHGGDPDNPLPAAILVQFVGTEG